MPVQPRVRGFLRVVALALTLVAPTLASGQTAFNRIVTFGDSLSDPGNAFVLLGEVSVAPYLLIPDAPYARGGLHFSNGKTWIEQLATDLAMSPSAGPALRSATAFSNYAVGAARARPAGAFDLATQVGLFFGDAGGTAPADALYVVFMGGNDLRDALVALAADPSFATSMQIVTQASTAIADNIAALAATGARRFLVANAPNLALIPAVRVQGPLAQGAAQFLSAAFNQALAAALANVQTALPSIAVTTFNVYGVINEVVAGPAAAGFTDVEHSCITPDVIAQAVCDRPDDHLFWDGIHPTRTGHAVLAQQAKQALGLPK
jgi:phospholipase/lecithinase/hemolysin